MNANKCQESLACAQTRIALPDVILHQTTGRSFTHEKIIKLTVLVVCAYSFAGSSLSFQGACRVQPAAEMDWEQFQPNVDVVEPESTSCQTPIPHHLLTHAISFALGSATTAYCLRWRRRTVNASKCATLPGDAGCACPPRGPTDGDAAVVSSSGADTPLPSSTPLHSVPSECSLRTTGAAGSGGGQDQTDASSMSLARNSGTGELEVALHEPTLAGIVGKAEYTGGRSATCSAQLLLQIALDAPARWTAADYEFVTHCKCLVSLADHDNVHLHTAAERIERLQNDIWKYIKLQLKRSEVGIQARDDKRKHSLACSTELQVGLPLRPPPASTMKVSLWHNGIHTPIKRSCVHCSACLLRLATAVDLALTMSNSAGGCKKRVPPTDARPLHQSSLVFPPAVAASMAPVLARAARAPLHRLQPRCLAVRSLLHSNPPPLWCAPSLQQPCPDATLPMATTRISCHEPHAGAAHTYTRHHHMLPCLPLRHM